MAESSGSYEPAKAYPMPGDKVRVWCVEPSLHSSSDRVVFKTIDDAIVYIQDNIDSHLGNAFEPDTEAGEGCDISVGCIYMDAEDAAGFWEDLSDLEIVKPSTKETE